MGMCVLSCDVQRCLIQCAVGGNGHGMLSKTTFHRPLTGKKKYRYKNVDAGPPSHNPFILEHQPIGTGRQL